MSAPCILHPLPYQADPSFWFTAIQRQPGAVLLDSGRPLATRGRFDILSAWPLEVLQPLAGESGRQFFERLRQRLRDLGAAGFEGVGGFADVASFTDAASFADVADSDGATELPFAGGLLGYLSYDFARRLETLPDDAEDDLLLPDARLGLYDWSLTTDHHTQRSWLVFHPKCPPWKRAGLISMYEAVARGEVVQDTTDFRLLKSFQPTVTRDTYRQAIERVQQYICSGDCYQVNYTQRFQAPYHGNPWQAYQTLRRACATPFAGYLYLGGDDAILSLSPERFIRLQQGQIETRPIKGTRPRGTDPDTDQALARELCASPKDRAENLMIVDLLRNDIGRSSKVGSVHVPELFSLESYPNVHHLVSSVRAELAPGLDVFDLLEGSFPGGSITGAPKIRAMQIIDELEPHRRSLYCGSLLYVDVRGEMDSSITIRSMLARAGTISCWAGGGIVLDSDWEDEYQESLDKVGVLLRALS